MLELLIVSIPKVPDAMLRIVSEFLDMNTFLLFALN
jgi:hypothetical protein